MKQKLGTQRSSSFVMFTMTIVTLFFVLSVSAQQTYSSLKHLTVTNIRNIDGSGQTLLSSSDPSSPYYSSSKGNLKSGESINEEFISPSGCYFEIDFLGPYTASEKDAIKAGLGNAVKDRSISNSENPVTVKILADYSLPWNTLASTATDWILMDLGNGDGSVWRPAFLLEHIMGSNQNANDWDIIIQWNKLLTWDLSTGGGSAGSNPNLMYIIMHEFSHGMGVQSSATKSAGLLYTLGWSGLPNIFDLSLEDINGDQVWGNPNYSSSQELKALFTSDIFFEDIDLYDPDPWSGQSVSHLEGYTGPNQLMLAFYNPTIIYTIVGSKVTQIHSTNGWASSGGEYIILNPTSATVSAPADNTTTALTSNISWTVSNVPSWYTVSPMSGSGDATLTITYQENTSTSSRTGDFTVSGSGETATFSLTQNGVAAYIVLTPDNETVSAPADNTTTALTSNISWTVSNVPSWYTVSPMSGSGDATLTITYQENTATTSRSDDFTVSGGSANATFSLTQNGAAVSIVLNPTSATVSAPAGTSTTALTSNTIWTVSSVANWYSVSPMSGTGDATLTITYQENTATTSRSDDFTVSGGSANATFSLTQNGAAAILVFNDLDTLEVPYSEGDTTAGLTSNCDWTVEVLTSDDADWVTVSPMNGSGNAILSVHCSENTNNFARTALIKVTGCDLVTEKMIHQDFLTGINDPVIKTNRSVYPNPCRTNINIELIKDDFRMEIINLQGQNALSRDVSIYSDREIQNWNISTLIPGTYLLKILNKEGVLVKKIIKN